MGWGVVKPEYAEHMVTHHTSLLSEPPLLHVLKPSRQYCSWLQPALYVAYRADLRTAAGYSLLPMLLTGQISDTHTPSPVKTRTDDDLHHRMKGLFSLYFTLTTRCVHHYDDYRCVV